MWSSGNTAGVHAPNEHGSLETLAGGLTAGLPAPPAQTRGTKPPAWKLPVAALSNPEMHISCSFQ